MKSRPILRLRIISEQSGHAGSTRTRVTSRIRRSEHAWWQQETKRNSDLTADDVSSTFAATPPLEGLRFMLSKCMTGLRAKAVETAVLGFYDISRAHFHSAAWRKIVKRTPPEDTGCPSGFALLDKSMYGTKDAAQCFDVACENAMTKMGYTTGLFLSVLIPAQD